MRHTLKLHGVTVGWSDLEDAEPDLGRAHGQFRAGIGYDLVQPVFRLYAEAVRPGAQDGDPELLARYYRARDALQLELVDDDAGCPVRTSAIHIADYALEHGDNARELDVLIPDAEYWERRLLAER